MTRVSLTAVIAGLALAGALGLGGSRSALAAPRLSLPCWNLPPSTAHPVVTCRLAGQGFAHRAHLRITYRVEVQWMQGGTNHHQTTAYQRTAIADAHGAFRRPYFWYTFPTGPNVRVWSLWVQAVVTDARGDHTDIRVGGQAD
jgi:hypothetical protein